MKKRHIRETNKRQIKKVLAEQNELDATTFTQLINGYRNTVNKCRLNQQDAFWGILLSEVEDATSFLGVEEAERTILGMVEEAFKLQQATNN